MFNYENRSWERIPTTVYILFTERVDAELLLGSPPHDHFSFRRRRVAMHHHLAVPQQVLSPARQWLARQLISMEAYMYGDSTRRRSLRLADQQFYNGTCVKGGLIIRGVMPRKNPVLYLVVAAAAAALTSLKGFNGQAADTGALVQRPASHGRLRFRSVVSDGKPQSALPARHGSLAFGSDEAGEQRSVPGNSHTLSYLLQ